MASCGSADEVHNGGLAADPNPERVAALPYLGVAVVGAAVSVIVGSTSAVHLASFARRGIVSPAQSTRQNADVT